MAAFGVYFGCSSACIAVCRDGRTDVIANDLGDRVTPAVVAFTDHDEAVGLAAKQGIYRNPVNTICNVKRLLGRAFDNEDVQAAVQSGPVKITEVDKKPLYQVTYKERSCTFSPVKIATIIYKKMMETAESSEGLADSHDAVLAVPFNFDEDQQQAIRDAATKAGFNVLRIITEPAAALLAYNIGQMDVSDNCLVLVFRVGHQSLDLTLVQVINGMYHVLASHSDPKTGGHMIDDFVVEYFANEFQRQQRGADCRGNKRSLGKLQGAVDTCKHVLSTVQTSQCSVESLYDGIDFSCTLSRSRFEALCSNFIQKCLSPLDEFLSNANFSRTSVSKVIMCGGCAKIPLLQQQVMEYFKDADMLASIAPDEVIAVGAAIQAGILCGRDNEQVMGFSSACELPCLPADVVILVGSGDDLTEFILFNASTPTPARRQVTFGLSPQETTFCLHLMQRSSTAKTSLAKIVMRELPLGASVSGVFHIRHDGSLHAKCSELTSNQIQDVIVEIVHAQDRSTCETGSTFVNCLVHSAVPMAVVERFRHTNTHPNDEVALETFRQRVNAAQTSPMGQPLQRAPGFDYVRWKPHGQQRKHHNPDEYIQTCQGLSPYTSSVAMSSWEGLEERRWAGLTQAPPEIAGMPVRSGYTSAGSRSNLGSRELVSK